MFRFTLRELLLLTLIAGLAAGWWIDRGQLELRTNAAEAMAHKEASSRKDAEESYLRTQDMCDRMEQAIEEKGYVIHQGRIGRRNFVGLIPIPPLGHVEDREEVNLD